MTKEKMLANDELQDLRSAIETCFEKLVVLDTDREKILIELETATYAAEAILGLDDPEYRARLLKKITS